MRLLLLLLLPVRFVPELNELVCLNYEKSLDGLEQGLLGIPGVAKFIIVVGIAVQSHILKYVPGETLTKRLFYVG